MPPLTDLLDGTVDAYRMRRIRVEDLLRRPIVTDHAAGVTEIIRDEIVMITGAAGSIGSELARQVVRPRSPPADPGRSGREPALPAPARARGAKATAGRRAPDQLANITNRSAMDKLISAEAPSVIFHAAAYKHVPMMEAHPSDAMFVNVAAPHGRPRRGRAGRRRAVRARLDRQGGPPVERHGRQQASRRDARRRHGRRTGRAYVSVRFGNVLGSNGSVVPIFQEQLENGEPLTITDPAHDPLLHDHPGGRLADPRCAALGPGRATCSCSTWASRSRSWTWPATSSASPAGTPTSQPIEIVGLRPGREAPRGAVLRLRPRPTSAEKILLAEREPLAVEEVESMFAEIGLLVLEGDAAGLAAKVSELSAERRNPDSQRGAPAPLVHSPNS